jgi:hypothetical protein
MFIIVKKQNKEKSTLKKQNERLKEAEKRKADKIIMGGSVASLLILLFLSLFVIYAVKNQRNGDEKEKVKWELDQV